MSFQKPLLEWFKKNQRPLPWREHYRPYEVWISEIMLQQTQMETVLPYFRRWMSALPDVASLAGADEKKVLKLWEGLGYYSRARNLHESAKRIVQKHGGLFPSDYDTILSLKGIGRYTAGAISSIAFNQEKPIVDGNVLRVLSRVYAIKKPIDVEKNKAVFWKLQESLIPRGKAREFNQALMELGALVCGPQNPSCAICPIQKFCAAWKNENPEDYPVRKNRKKTVKVAASALVLQKNGKYLIRLRPLGEIMGGLWEFPEWKLARNKKIGLQEMRRKTLKLARKEFRLETNGAKHLGFIKRNYTHHLETLEVFTMLVQRLGAPQGLWVAKHDFKNYPFSSAHAKIAQLIQ